jgi:hypothetical protein
MLFGKASKRTVAYPKRWINDPLNEFRYKTLPDDINFPDNRSARSLHFIL